MRLIAETHAQKIQRLCEFLKKKKEKNEFEFGKQNVRFALQVIITL